MVFTLSPQRKVVVKSGGECMGKGWENVVKRLSPLQRGTDILTKTSFLTLFLIKSY